jgi:hypothetical protein
LANRFHISLAALIFVALILAPMLRAATPSDYTARKLFQSLSIAGGAYAAGSGRQYGVSGSGNVNNGLRATVWNGQPDVYSDLGSGWINDALGATFAGNLGTRATLWTAPDHAIDMHPTGTAIKYSESSIYALAPGLQGGRAVLA